MTKIELQKRVGELEEQIRQLEARPPTQIHYHYAQPAYVPPYYNPSYPQYTKPYIIWGGTNGTAISGDQQ